MKKIMPVLFGMVLLLLGNSCVVNSRPVYSKTVVVKKIPRNHEIVVVKGKRYYTWEGRYYKKTNRGYLVVKI